MLTTELALLGVDAGASPAPPQKSAPRAVILAGTGPRRPEGKLVKRTARALAALGVDAVPVQLLSPEENSSMAPAGLADALAERLIRTCRMISGRMSDQTTRIGIIGFGDAGPAALRAAAELGDQVSALAICSADPEPAWHSIPKITAPTWVAVCGKQLSSISDHRRAFSRILAPKHWAAFPDCAGPEDPASAEQIAAAAAPWLAQQLASPAPPARAADDDE